MTIARSELNLQSGRQDVAARILEQLVLCAALALFYYANVSSHRPLNMMVLANDAVTVFFITFRRSAKEISHSASAWVLALGTTAAGMLMRPGGTPLLPQWICIGLLMVGFMFTISSKCRLNWSFGIAPANRGVQVQGIYAFVRHPMYLGYMLIQASYVANNPTIWNAAVLGFIVVGQVSRIRCEEFILRRDPAYRSYLEKVHYRLIYGLY